MRRVKLPKKLPKTVMALMGPVAVRFQGGLRDHNDKPLMGQARYAERVILIDPELAEYPDPTLMWRVFYHELQHYTLEETGVAATLTYEQMEAVCDATGSARVAEMAGRGTK